MRRVLSLTIALLLLISLTACGPADGGETTTTTGTTTTTTVTVADGYNALTGKYDLPTGASNRPIGIMVPNDNDVVGKQVGIDKADFYMECETEGTISRLLTVFSSIESIPETYGPIRSSRTPFVATARALDVVYVHAGGSKGATALLNQGVVDRFNALVDSKTFWRDPALKAAIDTEHSLVTGKEKLKAKFDKSDYSKTITKNMPFVFGEATGDITANKAQVHSTPSVRLTFVYDSETGLYGKNIGTLENHKPHTSIDGDQIQVSNVLVVYAEKYNETRQHINFRTGTGSAYLISGGTAREISYTRTDDSLSFQEKDGSTAKFATGKIYMILCTETLKDKAVFE